MIALKYFLKRMFSRMCPVAICTSIVEGSRTSGSTHRQVLSLLITLLAKYYRYCNPAASHVYAYKQVSTSHMVLQERALT